MATAAPSTARRHTTSAPIPREPPVTSAALPLSAPVVLPSEPSPRQPAVVVEEAARRTLSPERGQPHNDRGALDCGPSQLERQALGEVRGTRTRRDRVHQDPFT